MGKNGCRTKKEIVADIGGALGVPKAVVADVLEVYMDTVAHELVLYGRHKLLNEVGTLKVIERKARPGRNPKTGERIEIAAHRTVAFRPAKRMKVAVNG